MTTVTPVCDEEGNLLDFDLEGARPSGLITDDSDFYVAENEVHNRFEGGITDEEYEDEQAADTEIASAYFDLVGGEASYRNLCNWAQQSGWEHVQRFDDALEAEDWGDYEMLLQQLKEDFTAAGGGLPDDGDYDGGDDEIDDDFIVDEDAMLNAYEQADDSDIEELIADLSNPFWDPDLLQALGEANAGDAYGELAALMHLVATGEMDGEEALAAASERYPEHVLYHLWSECRTALLNNSANYDND